MQNYNSKYKSDLKARCYKFSLNLISLVDSLPKEKSSWIIGDQILRSGTSIGANLVEAKASSSRLEFKKFHEIALKSANETKYWLELLKDSKKIDIPVADKLIGENIELANMIASGVLRLKGKKNF
jgi:four helix bundle protein